MQDLHKMIRIAAGCLTLGLFAISGVVAQTTAGSSSVPNAPTPNVSLPGTQSPFLGSEPEGKASAEVLQIDFTDAINREGGSESLRVPPGVRLNLIGVPIPLYQSSSVIMSRCAVCSAAVA